MEGASFGKMLDSGNISEKSTRLTNLNRTFSKGGSVDPSLSPLDDNSEEEGQDLEDSMIPMKVNSKLHRDHLRFSTTMILKVMRRTIIVWARGSNSIMD